MFLFSVFIYTANAQQQVKIMTYNLLNYPSPDTNIRNPYFRTVISSVNPDILVVSEMSSLTGVNTFMANVLNYSSSTYSAGFFINGFDTDNALFFKTSKFNFIFNTAIHTQLRDINEFKIADKIYGDTLRIYAVHLKANGSDSLQRAGEIDSLRKRTNQLPEGTDFIVLGDFNLYASTESAYKKLIMDNPSDDGNFLDPLTLTGTWNRNSYAPYHTQSTRVRSFGDGATGGLDDRFDMILYSNAVKNFGGIKFIPGTYTAYGNDGQHFNDSINQIPNNAVSQSIANALHYATDHLPVYAVFEFGNATTLNVKVIPEGLYNISLNKLNRKDTVIIYLRNTLFPFSIIDTAKALLDSISFNAVVLFRAAESGTYYLEVKHRNSIETWSMQGGMAYYIDSVLSYDFTNSVTQAFGNNLIQKGTKFCIYGGDINQDGIIDLIDLSLADNDSYNFASGYLSTDINGDYLVDVSDISIIDNNAYNVVTKITP
ncbi:MAG: endonuclease/exonuclease/phosphatase family protein [bacterium]